MFNRNEGAAKSRTVGGMALPKDAVISELLDPSLSPKLG